MRKPKEKIQQQPGTDWKKSGKKNKKSKGYQTGDEKTEVHPKQKKNERKKREKHTTTKKKLGNGYHKKK